MKVGSWIAQEKHSLSLDNLDLAEISHFGMAQGGEMSWMMEGGLMESDTRTDDNYVTTTRFVTGHATHLTYVTTTVMLLE